jgi:adenylate kinase
MESVFRKNKDAKGFVLDGFPRTIKQAEELDEMLKKFDEKITSVLSLKVDEEELVKRLLKRAQDQGRKDDTEEVIKNRLIQYHQHTKPLIDYYNKMKLYQEVIGVGSIEDIFTTLCSVINVGM